MVRFTKESIERLRDAVDIVEIISRSVHLKKMGGSLKGLCPFHSEKTPSFTVHRSSNHYHCFGCGAHGDSLSFLMKHEGMGFTQALLFLSERFQVTLEEEHVEGKSHAFDERARSRLKSVLEKSAHFFHIMLLYSDEAAFARKYLIERQFFSLHAKNFLIGYSPVNNKGFSLLQRYLKAHGFSEEEMIAAGVAIRRRGELYDFFTGRIMFPIFDQMGAVIGFSARKIDSESYGGKYINTPETALFKKSKVLFGLFYSKKRIVKNRQLILVEGQLDALRLISSGFDYTVATLGTAFNELHITLLKMLGVEKVYVAFDSDEAGLHSSIKVGHLLMKHGIAPLYIDMELCKDPDEFILQKGRSKFLEKLITAPDHVQFTLLQAQKQVDWSSGIEREKALRKIIEEIKEWNNPLLERESIRQLAGLVQVPVEFLQEKAEKKKGPSIQKSVIHPSLHLLEKVNLKEEGIDGNIELELDLLRSIIAIPHHKMEARKKIIGLLDLFDFTAAITQKFFEALLQIQKKKDQNMSFIALAGELDWDDDEEKYIQHMIQKPAIRSEKIYQHIYEAVQKVKERRWIIEREDIRKRIDKGGSESEQIQLLEEFARIKAPILPPLEKLIGE